MQVVGAQAGGIPAALEAAETAVELSGGQAGKLDTLGDVQQAAGSGMEMCVTYGRACKAGNTGSRTKQAQLCL